MYTLKFDGEWGEYFRGVPPNIQRRFKRRMGKYENFPTPAFRHAKHGVRYFIDEIGQYRVCFISDEDERVRIFYFIGNHKSYGKFLGRHK